MSAERDIGVYLQDILESIERIEEYAKDLSKSDLFASVNKQDAIVHRLEVIGEAAKHVPEKFRMKHPQIPWQEIARTRDKIRIIILKLILIKYGILFKTT